MTHRGDLPPRDGAPSVMVGMGDDDSVPIRFEIGEHVVELSAAEALAVAGRITATVECYMRSGYGQ